MKGFFKKSKILFLLNSDLVIIVFTYKLADMSTTLTFMRKQILPRSERICKKTKKIQKE